jgi:PHD/YefM family antitoxin component YafN of YafNO toxin-antitoxin module
MDKKKCITVRFSDSEYKVLVGMAGDTPIATYIRQHLFEVSDSHSDSHEAVTVTDNKAVTVTNIEELKAISKEKKDRAKEYLDQVNDKLRPPENLKELPESLLPEKKSLYQVDSAGNEYINLASGKIIYRTK